MTNDCDECRRLDEARATGTTPATEMPTRWWHCGNCGAHMARYRGDGDQSCRCGAWYNACGQRLRDDWTGNLAWSDADLDDLEGFERQQLALESE